MKTFRAFFILIVIASACNLPEKDKQAAPLFANLDLPAYSKDQLAADFDLLVKSLKEAHTGLYWYSTEKQFDSIVAKQKLLLKDSLNGLAFYNIVAPIVAFTKEDHCDISLPEEISQSISDKGLFLPLSIINLKTQPFILNNPIQGKDIKGFMLLAVNGVDIKEIYQKIFNSFASDGYIQSSKFRYLDFSGFAREYAIVMGQEKENRITVLNPKTNKEENYILGSVSEKDYLGINKTVFRENNIRAEIEDPARLEFTENNTAVMTFETFSNKKFGKHNMKFKEFVDSAFKAIAVKGTNKLIIDMRNNGGGSEGNEDFLFSYLTDKPYSKYKYVQVSGLTFSFLNFTDYAEEEDRKELEEELKEENQLASDGKYYRKPGIYITEPVKSNFFKGQVYVLTSGWTYSGGAEFSTLMKEHTNALFIGEETGGGYYGNTSGTVLELTLPASKLKIEIPILKFVLDVKKGKPGRGVIPDHEIQPTFNEFINGYDAEMEYAKKGR